MHTVDLAVELAGPASVAVACTREDRPTEVLLWDTQYHLADARRVADRIAASGRRLKAIVLSHPDHDHYAGAAAIVRLTVSPPDTSSRSPSCRPLPMVWPAISIRRR